MSVKQYFSDWTEALLARRSLLAGECDMALAGGAAHVTSVDSSAPALERATAHVALNGHDPARHTALDADVNQTLRRALEAGETYDAIVLDPPKFAPTVAHAERASRAYKDINRLALKLLARGGVLLQSNADFFRSFSTRRKALRLLREGWIRVLGTDCHNMTSRAPHMDEAVRRIARSLGEDAVLRLEAQAAALLPAREAAP